MKKDKQMILQIKNRNEEGLRQLIDQYAGLLMSIIHKTLAVLPEHQEECLNDVLLAIWTNIEQYDETKSSFKNWICVIAKYRAINYLKKYSKTIHHIHWEEEKHEQAYAHTDKPFEKELWEIELEALFEPLNERDKKLFRAYFDSSESTETIAKRYRLTPGALYSRISRGKRKIREFFLQKGRLGQDE